MKNICTKNVPSCEISWVPNNSKITSDSAFTVHCECPVCLSEHKPSVALETYQLSAFTFQLLKKGWADVNMNAPPVQTLLYWLLPDKIESYCFGNLRHSTHHQP